MKTLSRPFFQRRMRKRLPSDIEFVKGMTKATTENEERRWRISFFTQDLLLFFSSLRAVVQPKLARKIHGKKRSKKNLESLYEVIARMEHQPKGVIPTDWIIKMRENLWLRYARVTMKFGTKLDRQTPLKLYADHCGLEKMKN